MKDLRLSLKGKWFEMTKSGIKKEDYRNINQYWFKRLVWQYKKVFRYLTGVDWDGIHSELREVYIQRIINDPIKRNQIGFMPFAHNIMTHGYPSNSEPEKILKYKHEGIEIREGKEELGAEKGKLYFVIKHGEVVE